MWPTFAISLRLVSQQLTLRRFGLCTMHSAPAVALQIAGAFSPERQLWLERIPLPESRLRSYSHAWHAAGYQAFSKQKTNERLVMLSWTLIFLIVALVAMALGFWGVAGVAATIAKILFFVFLVLFLISLLAGRRGRSV